MAMPEEKSKILIIGGTGWIGKFLVRASIASGHPTFALVREATAGDPAKAAILDGFKKAGVTILIGDIKDYDSLLKAVKKVDVVISAVSLFQVGDQNKLIDAIKEAGNIKRFVPSEFGLDPNRIHTVEPLASAYAVKRQIRRAIEAAGIPCTFVSSNYFAGYYLPNLAQPELTGPPTDEVIILGDGNPKAIFVDEEDIGTYTIKAVDDPRTLNKAVYMRPPANVYSHNELVALWEKKTGNNLQKIYVPEDDVIKKIQEAIFPVDILLALDYSTFVKGDMTNFKIEPSFGVEASELYPDVKYTTVDEYFDRLI